MTKAIITNAPLSEAADDADAGGEPGAGGAGEPANPEMTPGVHNDAGAEKADPGQDSLHHPAARVGNDSGPRPNATSTSSMAVARLTSASVFNPIGLPCRSRLRPISAAGERGDAKTQYDFGPVQQRDRPPGPAQPCFGSRPIM